MERNNMERDSAAQECSQIYAVIVKIIVNPLDIPETLAALEKRYYVSLTNQGGCT